MSFDTVLATLRVADFRRVIPSLDVDLAQHLLPRAAGRSLHSKVGRFTASGISDLPEQLDIIEANSAKVQQAELFSRRNELVQDRDGGSVWPTLASSFIWGAQPCRR